MKFVRLGPLGDTSYTPDLLVENYESLIWTERFNIPGEFELTTPDLVTTREILPEGTLVSLLETDEVAMVETHEVAVDENGVPSLIVRGRTVDFFFEHRHVEGSYNKKRKMAKNYSPRGAAAVLMWNAVDNSSDVDVTRNSTYPVPGRDQIPNVMITDSSAAGDESRRWWLKEGPLYPQLFDILNRYDLGLRTIRPKGTESAQRVKVLTVPANRGDIDRSIVNNISALRFDLFVGVDRSHTQSNRPVVSFNAKHGDVITPSYLLSIKDYKTACEIMSGAGGSDQYRNNTEKDYTGWSRRVMSHDAGEPEYPNNATNAEKSNIDAEFKEDAETDALRALKRTRKVRHVTGDISPYAPYQYKQHYNLGDAVTLYGRYGITEKMIVSEYVRTEDSEGDRGYPGLVAP